MISRNGIELTVGLKVLVLRTPIKNQHEFYEGVITKLTDKQVVVEGKGQQHKWRYGGDDKESTFEYKRYPEQVIVI
ncbi:hypothetical protein BS46_gp67 [Acinetobacter phage BS46]|nr:hypothetical protein BS46_gp67 [Acinetobacter phage BS46]